MKQWGHCRGPYWTKYPDFITDFFSIVMGFAMLAIGLFCIFLIAWKFLILSQKRTLESPNLSNFPLAKGKDLVNMNTPTRIHIFISIPSNISMQM